MKTKGKADKKVKIEIKKKAGVIKKDKPETDKSLGTFGVEKIFDVTGNKCTVTFKLPLIAAPNAKRVTLVGDFNNWDSKAIIMKKNRKIKGMFSTKLELDTGKEYQYRYLIDDNNWENDWKADKYVPTPFGTDNSVIVL